MKIKLDSIKNTVVELEERNKIYEQMIKYHSDSLELEIIFAQGLDNIFNENYILSKEKFNEFINRTTFDYQEEKIVHYYLGYAFFILNDIENAINTYNVIISQYQSDETVNEAAIYLGRIYFNLGEYQLALSIINRVSFDSKNKILLANRLKSSIYSSLGDSINAEKALLNSELLKLDKLDIEQNKFSRASNYLRRSNFSKAIEILSDLINSDIQSGDFFKSWTFNNYSYALNKVQNDKGIIYADSSLSIIKKLLKKKYNYQYSISYQNKAEYYSNQQEHDRALLLIDSAIYNHCYGISINGTPSQYTIDPILLDDKQSLIDYMEVKIDILKNAKDEIGLEKSYLFMDSLIQAIREERFDDKSRFFHQAKLSKYYKDAFQFFLSKDDFKQAYAFSQKMKNIILLENLHYKNAYKTLPVEYQKKYSRLTDSIKDISLLINSEMLNDSLSLEVEKLKLSLVNFTKQLKNRYPLYHRMRYNGMNTSIESIQEICDKDQVVMDYFISDSLIHIFMISNHSFQYFNKQIDTTFINSLNEQINKISTRPNILNFDEEMNDIHIELFKLKDILIPEELNEYKSIVIIPYDRLFYFPFETLINDMNSNCPYLICSKSISYSFSSNLWRLSKMNNETTGNRTMIYSPYQKNINGPLFLPFAKRESSQIEKFTQADLFTELDVESFFTTSKAYNIHHFLSHAFIDNDHSDQSYLSLGEQKDSISIDDIVKSNLKSKLVCLSACDSGVGSLKKEEGVISLARGFLQSGAESIVMSSFKVSDRTGSKIMTNFYKNLCSGFDKASSLAEAKRNYLKTSSRYLSHPYFWSAFTVQGNEEAIFKKDNNLIKWFCMSIPMVFALFGIRKVIRATRSH